jgi:hypothetical protein
MKTIILWLAKIFGVELITEDKIAATNRMTEQANAAIAELEKENLALRGAVKTVIIKPPSESEFKEYCKALDNDLMFRYMIFTVIDKYYRDLINNHDKSLADMYRGRLLGIEELKKQIHDNAFSAKVSSEIESILGVMQ